MDTIWRPIGRQKCVDRLIGFSLFLRICTLIRRGWPTVGNFSLRHRVACGGHTATPTKKEHIGSQKQLVLQRTAIEL